MKKPNAISISMLCSLATLSSCSDTNSRPQNSRQQESYSNYQGLQNPEFSGYQPYQNNQDFGDQNVQNSNPSYNRGLMQYNSKSIDNINGRLVAIMKVQVDEREGQPQIQLIIRTDKGEIPVLLGPEWYVQDGLGWIRAGDEIEAKGSIIYVEGRIFMIASDVRTRDYDLKLRDSAGMPLWSGWRKR